MSSFTLSSDRLERSVVWMDNNNKIPEPNLNIQDESNKTYQAKEGELVLYDVWIVFFFSCENTRRGKEGDLYVIVLFLVKF